MGVENCPFVTIGISFESYWMYAALTSSEGFVYNLRDVVQSPFKREVPVVKVATDLYNFLTSFAVAS